MTGTPAPCRERPSPAARTSPRSSCPRGSLRLGLGLTTAAGSSFDKARHCPDRPRELRHDERRGQHREGPSTFFKATISRPAPLTKKMGGKPSTWQPSPRLPRRPPPCLPPFRPLPPPDASAASALHPPPCAAAEHDCEVCGKRDTKACTNCTITYYCCKECQVEDCPKHKTAAVQGVGGGDEGDARSLHSPDAQSSS